MGVADVRVEERAEQQVETPGTGSAEQGATILAPGGTLGGDHDVCPGIEGVGDEDPRVVVDVEHDDVLTGGHRHAVGEGISVVGGGHLDHVPRGAPIGEEFPCTLGGVVDGTVLDEEQFPRVAERVHLGADVGQGDGEERRLVVDRYDDAQTGAHRRQVREGWEVIGIRRPIGCWLVDTLDRIFKAYDVRGRVDTGDLTEEIARHIGAAFAAITDEPTVAVGRDCRLSSPGMAAAFIEGIRDAGKDVLDIGEVSTDVIYFVAGDRGVAGAMITASHNPPTYNGIKLCRAGAVPVGEATGLSDIKALVRSGSMPEGAQVGDLQVEDVRPGYAEHLFGIVDPGAIAPLSVALDGGNGMAGAVLPSILGRLPISTFDLYLEPDGTFPNHPADPLDPANIVEIRALVTREGADLGVAFDGDADRAFFIDDQGVPLSGSTTTALIARWFLARHQGASIVHNLITSRAVPEVITAAGGTPVRTRVGHSFIKAVMAETDAVFGGEHSGHYYFRDNFRADSGLLAMLVLLQVRSEEGRPLSELRTEVEPYAQSGEINLDVEDKEAAMQRVVDDFIDAPVDRLDGVTIDLGDRWCNLRPSNTEPVLRLNVEAPTSEDVDAIVHRVRALVAGAA